ncbi:biotin--[acetyl-CoA-carboxylase] ligase [Thermococcus sp.]
MIGSKVIRLDEIDSTNEYAKGIASEVPEGTVVIAKTQRAGKGRRGRRWASPEGGLWMSVVLKPEKPDPRLAFVGALAVVDALGELGIKAWVKWPNDVWVGRRKIAGILTEARGGEFVVMGIGLNVNNPLPEELKGKATSIKALIGREIPLEDFVESLLRRLDRWYAVFLRDPEKVVREVRERMPILGKAVEVATGEERFSGEVADLLPDGSLLLKTKDGMRRVLQGDVSLRLSSTNELKN